MGHGVSINMAQLAQIEDMFNSSSKSSSVQNDEGLFPFGSVNSGNVNANGKGISVESAVNDDNVLAQLNNSVATNEKGTIFEAKPGFKNTLAGKLLAALFDNSMSSNACNSGDNLARMAYMDRDNDGYISKDESEQESYRFMYEMNCVGAQGNASGCGDSVIKSEFAGITTINGHKVYAVGNMYKGVFGSASFSEEEMQALDSYYAQNGEKADIDGAAEAMGVKINVSKDAKGQTVITFTGQSGVETSITINKALTGTEDGIEDNPSSALWYVYSLLRSNCSNFNNPLDHRALANELEKLS